MTKKDALNEGIAHIEFNIKTLKEKSIPATLKVSAPALFKALNSIEITNDSIANDEIIAFKEKLKSSDTCTVVYGACSGCYGVPNAGWVYYYCNSSGGSQPDYTECITC